MIEGVPDYYKCSKCGAHGCKLWRGYQEWHFKFLCIDCAEEGEGKPYNPETYQIGWQVPAIPSKENSCWGLCSSPMSGVAWWHKLPLRALPKLSEEQGTIRISPAELERMIDQEMQKRERLLYEKIDNLDAASKDYLDRFFWIMTTNISEFNRAYDVRDLVERIIKV